jgi:hypothetical protein
MEAVNAQINMILKKRHMERTKSLVEQIEKLNLKNYFQRL